MVLQCAVRVHLVAVLIFAWGAGPGSVQAQEHEWHDIEAALAIADTAGQLVLVHVYAPWCGWCRKMTREVYPSKDVQACIDEHFIRARLNREDTETTYRFRGREVTPRQLASHFGADTVPTTILLSSEGATFLHVPGFMGPEAMRTLLAFVASGAYTRLSLDEYRARFSPQC